MNKYILLAIFTGLFMTALPECYGAGYAGTTGAQILEISPSVRARGMGGAYCAVSDDSGAVFYNPAGLALIKNVEIASGVNMLAGGIDHKYLGYAYCLSDIKILNVEEPGTIAFAWNAISAHDIVGRDASGNYIGNVSAKEQALIGSYGKTIIDSESAGKLMAGVNAKFYKDELYTQDSEGWAYDYGLLWKWPGYGVFIGASIQNTGSDAEYIRQKEPLPESLNLGVSAILNGSARVALDLKKYEDEPVGYSFGIERSFAETFVMRAGYDASHRYKNTSGSRNGKGLTLGLGINLLEVNAFFFHAREICFDYAFVPFGSAGDEHWLVAVFKLGAD